MAQKNKKIPKYPHGGPIKQWELPTKGPGVTQYDGMYGVGNYGLFNNMQQRQDQWVGYGNPANLMQNQLQQPMDRGRTPVYGSEYAIDTQGGSGDPIGDIRKQYMQKGGKTKKEPIYVSDPKDPRLQAYNDSLNLYNKGEVDHKRYADFIAKYKVPKSSTWVSDKPIKYDKDASEELAKIQPISIEGLWYDANGVVNTPTAPTEGFANHIFRYKQPVQPVKIGQQIDRLSNTQQSQPYQPQQVQVPPYTPVDRTQEWYSNSQGIPINTDNVQQMYNEDGTRKYKNGGQTMRVKILSAPKESTLPQNRVNPFSVPDEFKYGGALPTQGSIGNNRRIDTYSDFLRQPMKGTTYQQSPYSNTGKQLPEVPEGTEDAIVVEKQEQVMGDFNGDGMPVLMGTNVGSHDSGDDLTTMVPDGSFVFSDTKELTIKDPQILAMFGMTKPATPAQIAKKYDLQKYKAILDDSDRSEIDKNTARLMYQNYVNKLNLLASVQEEMKNKQDEMRQSREYKKGGQVPMYYDGGKKGKRNYDDYGDYDESQQIVNREFGRKPAGKMKIAPSKRVPKSYANNPIRFDQSPVGYAPIVPYIPGVNENYMTPITDLKDVYQLPVAPNMGEYTPTTVATNPYVPIEDMNGKKKKRETTYDSRHPFNPDTLAGMTAAMRALQYPDYNPVRQVAHGAVGQPVFLDPTRAKAAIQEGVNSASNAIAMGATGPVSRANILALQGKAGADAANVEAQYAQQNAQIANRTNEQAAGLYNQFWKDQQNYNKEYVEETHNAQMDKLGYQNSIQNELLKQAYMAENRKRTAQNYNYVNPYYTMDSRGYIYPKSEEQMKAMGSIGQGRPGGSGKGYTPFDYMDAAVKAGNITDPETIKAMRQKAALAYMQQLQGPRMSQAYDPNTGMPGNTRYSGYDYDGDGSVKKMGGYVKKSKVKIVGLPSK